MQGSAVALGAFLALTQMQVKFPLECWLALAINHIGPKAYKPNDVITAADGTTIEIVHTDAEGRMVLADTLALASRLKPKLIIDYATLTGACIVALGKVPSAVLGNHPALIRDLIQSGKQIEDKLWELPLWDEYQEQLNSNFADIANIGGRDAGTITAACFLSRFTKKYKWAHLDIAGTAWKSGDAKGATGRPVPLLCQFIINQI